MAGAIAVNPVTNKIYFANVPPGSYTAQVSGAGGDIGVALVEVYAVPSD